MSNLASKVLCQLIPCPLSIEELAEDFEFDDDDVRRALRELQNAGQVKRVDDPWRDEGPFYAIPFSDTAPPVETLANDPARRSYLRFYDNPSE